MVDTTCWKIGTVRTRSLQVALDAQLNDGGRLLYSEDNGATWREVGLEDALAIRAKTNNDALCRISIPAKVTAWASGLDGDNLEILSQALAMAIPAYSDRGQPELAARVKGMWEALAESRIP